MTRVVAAKLAIEDQISAGFMYFICSRLSLCERMLKLWKISAIDKVRNAMVVPSGLVVISQTPASI